MENSETEEENEIPENLNITFDSEKKNMIIIFQIKILIL